MIRRATALVLFAVASLLVVGCSSSESTDALRVDGRIDDVRLPDADAADPARLEPGATSILALSLVNQTDEPVTVSHIRLEGELLGLTFLTYDVRVVLEVPAGGTRFVEVPLDFFDLDQQAHGYLRTHLRTYDADRQRLSSDEFAVDVRGKPFSTMSVFALLLLGITVATAAYSLRDLARRSLPAHRMARGVRFLIPGLGVGLLLSAAFSILRIFPLPSSSSVPLTVIPALAAFAAGYFLTPAPDDGDDDLDEDDDEADMDRPVPTGGGIA